MIVAVAWPDVRRLLAEELLAAMPELAGPSGSSRPRLPRSISGSIGRSCRCRTPRWSAGLGQWVFADARVARQYCQVVVSGDHRVGPYRHDEWRDEILAELRAIWPEVARPACCTPVWSRNRPPCFRLGPAPTGSDRRSGRDPKLAVAGDWTATGWPATMERPSAAAVRQWRD